MMTAEDWTTDSDYLTAFVYGATGVILGGFLQGLSLDLLIFGGVSGGIGGLIVKRLLEAYRENN